MKQSNETVSCEVVCVLPPPPMQFANCSQGDVNSRVPPVSVFIWTGVNKGSFCRRGAVLSVFSKLVHVWVVRLCTLVQRMQRSTKWACCSCAMRCFIRRSIFIIALADTRGGSLVALQRVRRLTSGISERQRGQDIWDTVDVVCSEDFTASGYALTLLTLQLSHNDMNTRSHTQTHQINTGQHTAHCKAKFVCFFLLFLCFRSNLLMHIGLLQSPLQTVLHRASSHLHLSPASLLPCPLSLLLFSIPPHCPHETIGRCNI